jgi:hypothetical protein
MPVSFQVGRESTYAMATPQAMAATRRNQCSARDRVRGKRCRNGLRGPEPVDRLVLRFGRGEAPLRSAFDGIGEMAANLFEDRRVGHETPSELTLEPLHV